MKHIQILSIILIFGISTNIVKSQCVSPSFTANKTSICKGESINFNIVNPNNNYTYNWYFDNVQNGTGTSKTKTFNNSGSIEAKVISDSLGFCQNSFSITITVHSLPNANFSFTPNNQCSPMTTVFTNTSTGNSPFNYVWKDNGNQFSTAANPSRTFDEIGGGTSTKQIRLEVTDDNGCFVSKQQDVNVKERPDATLSDTTLFGIPFTRCDEASSVQIGVENLSSTQATNSFYTIDWGDGNTYSGATLPYATGNTYTNLSGYETITFTVDGNNNCSSVQTYSMFNGGLPSIGLSYNSTTTFCATKSILFPIDTATTNQNTPGTTYLMEFDDGSPSITFQHPIPPSHTHTFTHSSCNNTAQFLTQNVPNAFSISLTASNACGNSYDPVGPIRLSSRPVANFTYPTPVCVGTAVNFINTSDSAFLNQGATCNTNMTKNWSITPMTGVTINGSSNGEILNATFAIEGTYDVRLIVGNPCGNDTIVQQICIVSVPNASFDIGTNSQSDTTGCVPFTVSALLNTSNTTTNLCSETYSWSITTLTNDCANPATNPKYTFINSTNSASKNPQIRFDEPGEYQLTLFIDNECSSNSTFSRTIIVQKKPEFSLATIPNFCQNVAVNPTIQGFSNCYSPITTWQWTPSSGGTITNPNQQNPGSLSFNSFGNKTVTVKATNACGFTTDSKSFTINELPALPTLSANEPCAGQPLNVIQTGGSPNVTYQWQHPTGNSSNTNLAFPIAQTNMTGDYLLTSTLTGTGCQDTISKYVTVNPLPVINLTASDLTPCAFDNITITATGASSYLWQFAGGGGSIDNPLSINPTQDTTYTVRGTDANGCESTQSIFINTTDLPVVNAGNDFNPCFQTPALPVQLNGTPSGGTWSAVGSIAPNTLVLNTFTPNAVGQVSVEYSYTDTNTGCSNSDILNLNVVTPSTADAGADFSVCEGSAVQTLIGIPSGGTWTNSSNAQVTEFNPTMQGQYTFTYTYGSGSCENSDDLVITVHPLPSVTVQADFSKCANDSPIDLTESPPNGTWSSTGNGLTNTSTGAFDPSLANSNTETLTYTFTDNTTTCSNSDVVVATINPVTTADAGTNETICNITTDYPLTGFSPSSGGTWSGNGVTGNSFNSNGVSGNYNLVYSFTNSFNCTDTSHKTIIVNDTIKPAIGTDRAVCKNSAIITLSESVTGGSWTNNGSPHPGNTFNPTTAGTFTLIYTIEENTTCEASDTVVITVHDLPVLTINSPISLCEDAMPIDLTESPSGGTWSGTGISNINTGLFDVSQFTLNGTPQTATVTYYYTDANQCSNSASIDITINSLPIVNVQDSITYCEVLGDIILPIGSPSNGTWSGIGIVNPNTGAFNANQASATGVGVYNPVYSFTDGNTCTNTDTLQVRIEEADSISAGQPDTTCITSNAFMLTDFYPTTNGSWSGNGVSSIGEFTPSIAGVGLATLTYSVGTNTCLITDTKTVLVVDTPSVFAGNDQTACLNEPAFQLLGYSPLTGVWSGDSVTTSGEFGSSIAGTYILTYTVTESIYGCTNFDTKTITIHDLPIIDASEDTTLCTVNQNILLPSATSNVTGTGVWSGSNGIVANSNLSVNPFIVGVDTLYLTYTFTDDFDCVVSDSFKLEVNSPLNIDAGIDSSLCINTGLYTFVAVEPTGGTWSSSPPNIITPNGVFNSDAAQAINYTLTYEYDDGNGTCIVSDTRTITVLARPIVNAGIDETICIETPTFPLTGYSPTTSGTGTWTGNGVNSTGHFSSDIAGVNANPHTLTYTFVDLNNCENSDTKDITVVPLPVIDSLSGPDTLCNQPFGQQYNAYQNGSTTPNQGTWHGDNININGLFTPTDTGNFVIRYCYEDNNECENCDSMLVTVITPFDIDAGANDTFCFNTGNELLVPIEPSGGTWSSVQNVILSDGTFNTNISPNTYLVAYTVGGGTCLVSDSKTVTVRDTPTVFAGNDEIICIETPPFALSNYSPITTNAGIGTWTGTGITDDTLGIFSSDVAGVNSTAHTLTYTYIDTFDCVNSDTKDILVVPLPVIDSLVGADTICNQPIPEQYIGYQNEGAANDGWWTGSNIDSSGQFSPNGTGDYTITYCYINSNDCQNCDSMVVTVIEPEPIDAGKADTICIDEGIHILTAKMPTGGIWINHSAITNAQLGTFDPLIATRGWHTVTYQFGTGTCLVSDTTGVYVRDLWFVAPGADQEACDTDADFAITGFSPAGGVWTGTGIVDTIGIFSPTAVIPNTYPISYFYTDPITLCDTTRVKNVIIHPLAQPNFTSLDTLCLNVPFSINDLSTNTISWQWNFGDGNGDNVSDPTHTYTATGFYTIQLIATSIHGCIDSISKQIYVSKPPTAYFVKDTTEGCAPLPVNFTDSSTGDFINYAWDLGNGNTFNQANPPTQIYNQGTSDTTYFITLTTSNLCGQTTHSDSIIAFPSPQIAFAPDVFSGCTPLTVDFFNNTLGEPDVFYWDFGNGLDTFYNTNTISHTFYTDTMPTIYNVVLIAKNDCGFDTASTTITVNPVTVESFFNVDTTVGCQPLTLNFTDFSTPGTTIVYDFGDGGTGTTGDTTYTFQQAGMFKVVQYVTNGCGYDSTFLWINVLPAPTASFTSDNNICEDLPVAFTNTSQNTTGQVWNFGDGNTSTTSPTEHFYANSGTYSVSLTVFANGSQCPGSVTQNVTILPKPIANLSISDLTVCLGEPITINDNSTGNVAGIAGDLGDGNTFGVVPLTHTYADSGSYDISYVVTGVNGCVSDTFNQNVFVHPIPMSAFSFEILDSCLVPSAVAFTNLSEGAVGYEWTLGNGQILTTNNPTVFYNFSGTYTPNLTAISAFGCLDSSQQTFKLFDIPTVNFTFQQDDECEPSLVQFTNTSTNSNSFYWNFGDGKTSTLHSPLNIYSRGTYDVSLVVGADNTCFDTLSLTDLITVHPTPIANFYWADTMIDGRFKGVVQLHNTSIDATKYEWDFDDNTFSTDEHPTHYFRENNVYNVILTAINEFACSDDTTLPVQPDIFGTLAVPNIFAPEFGVGEDASFIPKGIGIKEGTFLIEVFDKAGERIWSCDALDEAGRPNCSWDGSYKGEILPQGAYVWKVKAEFINGRTEHYTGTVSIIR